MKQQESHPSFYALDLYAVGARKGELAAHVAHCGRCLAYVEDVAAAAAAPADLVERALRSAPERRAPRTRRLAALAGGLALAAAALLTVMRVPGADPTRPERADGTTSVRGGPAVAVYVKRGGQVTLWDGKQPLLAGDRIRLKVIPDGYRELGVFRAADGGGALEPLYRSSIDPMAESTLPVAWQLDDEPGAETLVVTLSRKPVNASQVVRARAAREADVWLRRLVIRKTPREGGQP